MNPLSKTFTRLFKRLSGPDGRRTLYIYSPDALSPNPERHPSWKRAEDAVQAVESGNKIFVQGCAATPNFLLGKLAEYGLKERLKDIELIHIPTVGPAVYNEPEYEGVFRSRSLFIGANCREAIACGRADTVPIFLSEIPLLFRRNIYQLDVAIIHVSPPDQHGFCSLGTSVDCTRAAVQNAKYIIAQVNQHMPRTLGDGLIHSSNIDCMVHHNEPLPEITPVSRSPEVNEIGRLIAENLVEDGATLQTGIGNLPDTVLHKLHNHKDLGFHSEMIGDTVVSLVEKGAMTNARKSIQTGKIVSSFAMGTKKLYSFLNDNSFVSMQECDFTNNISVISQNPRVTAINTCLEVDITGQVCSDSLGTYMYSGFGGQIDFIRGAASSLDGKGKPIIACTSTTEKGTSRIVPTLMEGFGGQMDFIRGAACSVDGEGKPIIACTSTTENGTSRIVPTLKEGAGVVTTRAHVHYIVTEFGIAYLFGKNLRQRAFELIKVAHPSERELLEKAAFDRFKCMPSP